MSPRERGQRLWLEVVGGLMVPYLVLCGINLVDGERSNTWLFLNWGF